MIRLEKSKSFTVCYNNIKELHKCGKILLDNSQVIGYYSGNIFDGYRAIIKVNGQRSFVGGATDSHLIHNVWKYLTNIIKTNK